MAAAFSLVASPAQAVELPAVARAPAMVETGDAGTQAEHRYRYRRNRGVDVGDILTGVLVIGTIASIARGVQGRDYRNRDRDYRYRDYRGDYRTRDYRGDYRDRDYRDYRDERRGGYESNGIERAAEMCADAVERDRGRVGDIDNAQRSSDGWYVSGRLESGAGWQCWIDNDGRIREVSADGGDFSYRGDSGWDDGQSYVPDRGDQWSDEDYARARSSARTPADEAYDFGVTPDYTSPAV